MGIIVCEINNGLLKSINRDLANAATELYGQNLWTYVNDTSENVGKDFEFQIAGDETLYEVVNGIPQNFEYERMT